MFYFDLINCLETTELLPGGCWSQTVYSGVPTSNLEHTEFKLALAVWYKPGKIPLPLRDYDAYK